VSAFDRSEIDVVDSARVEHVLAKIDPAVVMNATAYNSVDLAEAEPAAAFEGNALAVRNIALACRQTDSQLVHFSTDYVFDGTAGRVYTFTRKLILISRWSFGLLVSSVQQEWELPGAISSKPCCGWRDLRRRFG
jgi:nucleoside-diphosphate-sugar epimerase